MTPGLRAYLTNESSSRLPDDAHSSPHRDVSRAAAALPGRTRTTPGPCADDNGPMDDSRHEARLDGLIGSSETKIRLERALKELDQILGSVDERAEVPYFGPTLLASMSAKDQSMALHAEKARYEQKPEESAVHFCITSAIALLEVSQALLNQTADPSPQERQRQWQTLVAYTKTAGRSAYRAASILTDHAPAP